MINPREQFRSNPDYMKAWPNVVDSRVFQEAVLAAYADFNLKGATAQDMSSSAAMNWQNEGVKRFLHTLLSLADPEGTRRQPQAQNLNHNALFFLCLIQK